ACGAKAVCRDFADPGGLASRVLPDLVPGKGARRRRPATRLRSSRVEGLSRAGTDRERNVVGRSEPEDVMHFIDNRGITDPRRNLALEEYVLRHVRAHESYLLFYINEPSIIIGRNQNTIEEINTEFVRERGIHVVRRISGGGAVYHDLGNLNFSVITAYRPDRFNRYEEFTRPVIEVLHELGVPAELSG